MAGTRAAASANGHSSSLADASADGAYLVIVPKGHWKLAGGANHRFVVNIESEPQPGRRKSRDPIPSPLPGLAAFGVRNRWFAPPANFRDASGVRNRFLLQVIDFNQPDPDPAILAGHDGGILSGFQRGDKS